MLIAREYYILMSIIEKFRSVEQINFQRGSKVISKTSSPLTT